MSVEKDIFFERVLDLTQQIRLENDPNKMKVLIRELHEVLVRTLDLQSRERLSQNLARAVKPDA